MYTNAKSSSTFFEGIKGDLWGASLEFIGTFFFLTLTFGGVQSASASISPDASTDFILYASLAFGFSLLVSAWLFFRVTGGLFNPNVSLALLLVGIIGPTRFVMYSLAQLVGSIAAAAVVLALTPGPCSFNTVLHQGINKAQGVFIEMFITSFLVVAVLMLAVEKHQATPFAPVGVGLTLFVCELWAIQWTGGAVNTARAFGPAVVTGFPYNTHWVYWLGPFLGSILGTVFYSVLKHFKYWKFNPTAESTDIKDSAPDPIKFALEKTQALSRSGAENSNEVVQEPSTRAVDNDPSTSNIGVVRRGNSKKSVASHIDDESPV